MSLAYQKSEEFLMNRVRQLTNQINRTNAFVTENMRDSVNPLEIPTLMVKGVTEFASGVAVAAMEKEVPVINMCYLREVIVK